jgi:glycosyltransferase involved in cell wall biosynthesis
MKIGIDISRYIDKSGGVGIYAANLLNFLLKIDSDNEYLGYTFFYDCFPDGWNSKKEAGIFANYYRSPNIYTNFSINALQWRTRKLKKLWQKSSIEKHEAILGNPDIIHSTAYVVPELLNAKLVVTIHDLSFLLFPDLHTEENKRLLMQNLMYVNSRPSAVICDSEQTKLDLIKFFHVPEEQIDVVYLGVGHIFSDPVIEENRQKVLEKYKINGLDYLLCVSSIEPRKNFERIINVFSEMIKQEKYSNLYLVCAGGAGWKNEKIYELVRKNNVEKRVKFLGFVDERDLPSVYSGARLFLYPSLYEGFGLPVLEAMSSKVPVITSDVSSLPEVAGDAAVMINPYNEKDIFNAVENVLNNENLRKQLITEGTERANLFTWESTAQKTLEVYYKVYGQENI